MPTTNVSIESIRELRLFLWEECMFNRQTARIMRERNLIDSALTIDAHADKYVKHIQVLNDFFPVGDTAELDAANASAKRLLPKRVT